MNYIEVVFELSDPLLQEWLSALLFEEGAESIEEQTSSIRAYFRQESFHEERIHELCNEFPPLQQILFYSRIISPENWNAHWESSFSPVVVDDTICIRASFHAPSGLPVEIIIEPKMSFGTGHHPTTHLMISLMQTLEFKDKQVFDFGSGTGILSILAAKRGAAHIKGIDNEDWAVENAIENAWRNGVTADFQKSDNLQCIASGYDIFLANINRQVLDTYFTDFQRIIKSGGDLLLSGFLEADEVFIFSRATDCGFHCVQTLRKDGWIAQHYQKNNV
jgi:ribosomal protein L11 methyltransferase